MAEGEEDSGDAMLAVSASPHTAMRRDQPINLKSEESDDDSSCSASTSSSLSPRDVPPSAAMTPPEVQSQVRGGAAHPLDRRVDNLEGAEMLVKGRHSHRERSVSPPKEGMEGSKGQNHLNGLAGLMGLQNLAGLQNLHSQSNTPQHQSSQLLNTPLNLSINATGSMQVGGNNGTTPGVVPPAPPQLLTAPQPAAMPQFILASGQLVQGIQGAQLLIPTSQGIATQTILTIPVNHVTSNQIVNLALSNGQVITTTLANLQSMAQPHHLLAPTHNTASSASPPIIPATGLSPANATLTSQLLNGHNTSTTNLNNNNNNINSVANGLQHNLNQPPNLASHLGSNGNPQGQGSHAQGQGGHSQGQSHQQQLINALQQHQQQQQQQQHQQNSNGGQMTVQRSPNHFSNPDKSPPHPSTAPTNGLLSNGGGGGVVTPSSSMPSSPLNTAVINRLAATNSDLTITTTTTPTAKQMAGVPTAQMNNNNYPASMQQQQQHSPQGIDLLDDSPNQPTISQSNCNMVDGINLDEIKEFAKAFKLRRLSLGLTQTQVGQALSITEGPAYSQSAICSALATQMYCAAQLATAQQQSMYVQPEINSNARFEKLDITPKSAQKIKPVLERWMKEAEERYKSGQNHLTEFIGVEPSKKRKRRTSFTPQALELLNAHFERNTHPSGTEITTLAHQLGYEREVIRIWFCNKRQALKNTVRMMSKGGCPT